MHIQQWIYPESKDLQAVIDSNFPKKVTKGKATKQAEERKQDFLAAVKDKEGKVKEC